MSATFEFPSFNDYLFNNRQNRLCLLISAAAIIIQFVIFKYFYPFASYIHGDSFVYLATAEQNLGINTYMIGYSMFLRAFSVFSTSDFALTAIQYLLLEGSALFLLFSLFYFYKPRQIWRIILLLFVVLNPLFLYLSNLVSSDALFAALSMDWFAILIWIIHKPNYKLLIWHTLIIFFAFTTRYNALIYLLISMVGFLLSSFSTRMKVIGILASSLTIGLFVIHTGNQYKELTGSWQYSPFAGWQLANNAMYTYRYIDSAYRQSVPERFSKLDFMIRTYFDSTKDTKKHPAEALKASTIYMWTPSLPLFKYRNILFKNSKDSAASEFKKWASMGPLYKAYGWYIIQHYPIHFLYYFIWPNSQKYYAPPIEFLSAYNSGRDSVNTIAQKWFGYKSRRLNTRTKTLNIKMLDLYPILSGIINIVMLFSLLFYSNLKGHKQKDFLEKGVIVAAALWLLNAFFTIFSSSAALRFQVFPIIVTTFFAGILVDWMGKMAHATNKEKERKSSNLITAA